MVPAQGESTVHVLARAGGASRRGRRFRVPRFKIVAPARLPLLSPRSETEGSGVPDSVPARLGFPVKNKTTRNFLQTYFA
jgi:hypothetical protein